jgi:serine/threonine-protein kinase SRPK3
MKAIKNLRGSRAVNLPYLSDHFQIKGRHGEHLCLVLPVLSTNISHFRRSAPSKKLSSPAVKIIISQVLRALATLHRAGIVHGGKQNFIEK